MNKKYLLFAAMTALMFGACSDDINQGGENTLPSAPNTIAMKSLDPASQASRVQLPGQTRGKKADRLQLVAKIAPVSEAADHKWSATGIAIANGNAYVSWHSDHQATVPADAWGGALDVINIAALESNPGSVITSTMTAPTVKFNNVVAAGDNLYFPLTCYNNGAVVGRLPINGSAMDTIGIPGSSANAIAVEGTTLYAATGYAGGVYSMPTTFNDDTKFDTEDENNRLIEVMTTSASFGGKYIDGGYVLRTDDKNSYIVALDGTTRNTGTPLVSEEKYAEAYDPANGEWYPLTGDKAKYYGKHTMAVDGTYIYVGGGKGANSENGLRVYAATGLVWQNGTNTTAVCVDDNYVYAATGAGLRVYEKYDSQSRDMKLYAFEVKDYNVDGTAADAPNANQPEPGTTAHSSNFVAVGEGYIFVACGQSGVYVFKLDTSVEPEKKLTGFITSNGGGSAEVDEDSEPVTFTVPEGPAEENKTFKYWKYDKTIYHPGDTEDFEPGVTKELTAVYAATVTFKDTKDVEVICGETVPATDFPADPEAPEGKEFAGWVIEGTSNPFTSETQVNENITVVPTWKDHVYTYTLKFVGWTEEVASEITGVPGEMKQDENSFVIPAGTPVWGDAIFYGWSKTQKNYDFEDPNLLKAGDTFEIPEGQTEYTLYGVWASKMEGGDDPKPVEPDDPSLGGKPSEGEGE